MVLLVKGMGHYLKGKTFLSHSFINSRYLRLIPNVNWLLRCVSIANGMLGTLRALDKYFLNELNKHLSNSILKEPRNLEIMLT